MRALVVLVLMALIALVPVAVCLADETEPFDMRTAFEQTEEKEPLDDWYGMLEFQGGTTYDVGSNTARLYAAGKFGGWRELTGIVGAEFDVDENTEENGPVTALVGATYNLGSLKDHGVEVSWAEYFRLNVGACITYGWVEDTPTEGWGWRVMASAVDVSLSDGGAKRQRER